VSAPSPMPTVGEIARRLNEPVHRIEYVLRTRNIKPTGLAGNARVYTDDDVERIADELARMNQERDRREADRGY
jgi:DNA-binding transcriptional MerR regulator